MIPVVGIRLSGLAGTETGFSISPGHFGVTGAAATLESTAISKVFRCRHSVMLMGRQLSSN